MRYSLGTVIDIGAEKKSQSKVSDAAENHEQGIEQTTEIRLAIAMDRTK